MGCIRQQHRWKFFSMSVACAMLQMSISMRGNHQQQHRLKENPVCSVSNGTNCPCCCIIGEPGFTYLQGPYFTFKNHMPADVDTIIVIKILCPCSSIRNAPNVHIYAWQPYFQNLCSMRNIFSISTACIERALYCMY